MLSQTEGVLSGDIRTVSRLIRDIEEGNPEVIEILRELYPFSGNAFKVGITGPPGVGKSTTIDKLLGHIRKDDKSVGVLVVDPSSPVSKGAILGDRIRMQRHSLDDKIFIKSLATRGHLGGLTGSARSAIDILDAMGKDFIIIETVGVGQDEVDISKIANTTIMILAPGMGDRIQMLKAGILEVADIFVVNKTDLGRAEEIVGDISSVLDMSLTKAESNRWRPPVIGIQAETDFGVADLLDAINRHKSHLARTHASFNLRKSRGKVYEELTDLVKFRLFDELLTQIIGTNAFDMAVNSVIEGSLDPYTACEKFLFSKISCDLK